MAVWKLGGYTFPVPPSDYRTPSAKTRNEYVRTSKGSLIRDRRAHEARTIKAYILQWEAMPLAMYNALHTLYESGGQYVLQDDQGNQELVYFTHDGWQLELQLDGNDASDIWYEGIVTLETV